MKLPSLSYIPTYQTVNLPNGAKIAFSDTRGKNLKTIIFIHGLQSSSHVWGKTIENLQKSFRCIALDLPGHANSPEGDYNYSMFFYAQVVEQLTNFLDLQQVILTAHSMGAQIAAITALRLQAKVEKIIMIAPAGFEEFSQQEGQALINWFASQDKNFGYFPMIGQQPVAQNVLIKSVEGMLDEPVFNLLSDIKQPVLVLFGENDPLIPNRFLHPRLNSRQVAENGMSKLENAKLIMLPGCGHFIPLEKPEELQKFMSNFILEQ